MNLMLIQRCDRVLRCQLLHFLTREILTFHLCLTFVQFFYSAETHSQKQKIEAELRVMIKKLHRVRDQIKIWQENSDLRDRLQVLTESRHSIDRRMERFRQVEQETKLKAFSKGAMAQGGVMTPEEARRARAREWLVVTLEALSDGINSCEAEVEAMSNGADRSAAAREAESRRLTKAIDRRRWHSVRLEALIRLLDNEAVHADEVEAIEDDVAFFLEHADEDEFDMDEGVYDSICSLRGGSDGGDYDDDEIGKSKAGEEQQVAGAGAACLGATTLATSPCQSGSADEAVLATASSAVPASALPPLVPLMPLPLSALLGDELGDGGGMVTAWRATAPAAARTPAATVDLICLGCEEALSPAAAALEDGPAGLASAVAVLEWLLEAPAEASSPRAGAAGAVVLGMACARASAPKEGRTPVLALALACRSRAVLVRARARKAMSCAGVLMSGLWPSDGALAGGAGVVVASAGLAPAAAALAGAGLSRMRLGLEVASHGVWPAAFGSSACERDAPGAAVAAASADSVDWSRLTVPLTTRHLSVLDAWAAARLATAELAGTGPITLLSQLDSVAALGAATSAVPMPPGAAPWTSTSAGPGLVSAVGRSSSVITPLAHAPAPARVPALAPAPALAAPAHTPALAPAAPAHAPHDALAQHWAVFGEQLRAYLRAHDGPVNMGTVYSTMAKNMPTQPANTSLAERFRRVPGVEVIDIRRNMFLRLASDAPAPSSEPASAPVPAPAPMRATNGHARAQAHLQAPEARPEARAQPQAAAAAAAVSVAATSPPLWKDFEAGIHRELASRGGKVVRCADIALMLCSSARPVVGPDGAPAPRQLAELLDRCKPPLALVSVDGMLCIAAKPRHEEWPGLG